MNEVSNSICVVPRNDSVLTSRPIALGLQWTRNHDAERRCPLRRVGTSRRSQHWWNDLCELFLASLFASRCGELIMRSRTQQNLTARGLVDREDPPKRPFVLTRAFYAGSQRFGAMWTGDNLGTWEHLQSTVPMLLTNGIAGMTFSGCKFRPSRFLFFINRSLTDSAPLCLQPT